MKRHSSLSNPEKFPCDKRCGCHLPRRDFLKLIGAGTAGTLFGAHAVAGPFEASEFENLIPAEKKLSPDWVASLFARGERTVYRGNDLDKIGMPIGGIATGQLYLGGDGRLWHWDIFNLTHGTGAGHYANPPEPAAPLSQGFALQLFRAGQYEVWPLDRAHFKEVTFCGEYPIGFVNYRDPALPVTVSLEAFSPFVPLQPEDSNLPATVLRFKIKNITQDRADLAFGGWLENAVCLSSGKPERGSRRNRILRREGFAFLECSAQPAPPNTVIKNRPDIPFEDFEKDTYEGWTATGTAFGSGPIEQAKMPSYQGDVAAHGKRLVNTHNTRQGEDVTHGDAHTGTLTSKPFVIDRKFITFLIGGGDHKAKTCINLLIRGTRVDSATGSNENRMHPHSFDVREYAGQSAQLQIVDQYAGGWGNIGIDDIVFSDAPREAPVNLPEQPDFGTMGLALLNPQTGDWSLADLAEPSFADSLFMPGTGTGTAEAEADRPFGKKLAGGLGRRFSLEPGTEKEIVFVVAWHFPNLKMDRLPGGRHYAARFPSASAVVEHVAANADRLTELTRRWHQTWYDSSLPYWFLDRTFANTSILATSTCHWFHDGRFYGWEGVGCCAGTCTHVWHYAQAVGRIFPPLERYLREHVDFGLAFHPQTGQIDYRGEFARSPATDGQAGCILRAYREHQMSPNDAFLRRNWPQIRKALEYLIGQDGDDNGILEGPQPNTLDTTWYGPVSWLSSLYLAALRAGEEMAQEMGDQRFARQTRTIFERGSRHLVEQLWNGEYFIHKPDPAHPEAMRSANGCEIDQVFGQSWAFQIGLGRILDQEKVRGALGSLWKYNFTPDVGPYRKANPSGRWYAMPGEGGLLMCTWPHGDKKDTQGNAPDWAYGYFNECMNGFEYEVAGHMIWEGMVKEGLAVTRMIHDRYHASRRNPWNEVECGDHYARSMASYGVFLAACGYEYHGPREHLGFAPRLTPENFRAPFTAAEGWGTFSQTRTADAQRELITLQWGRLSVKTLAFEVDPKFTATQADVTLNGQPVPAMLKQENTRILVRLPTKALLVPDQKLEIVLR